MGFVAAAVALAGAATAGASIYNSNQANKSAEKQMNAQLEQQKSLEDQLYGRTQKEESQANANAVQRQAKERQRQLAAAASGRKSTILTSPLGVTGDQSTGAQKTVS